MKNLNACLASLNLGLPDDVRRLKEAGYYTCLLYTSPSPRD